jgi:hypothetical protein
MRDVVIPIVSLFKDVRDQGIDVLLSTPTVESTVFEDNRGAMELVNAPKMRQQYHHFREHVKRGTVGIKAGLEREI